MNSHLISRNTKRPRTALPIRRHASLKKLSLEILSSRQIVRIYDREREAVTEECLNMGWMAGIQILAGAIRLFSSPPVLEPIYHFVQSLRLMQNYDNGQVAETKSRSFVFFLCRSLECIVFISAPPKPGLHNTVLRHSRTVNSLHINLILSLSRLQPSTHTLLQGVFIKSWNIFVKLLKVGRKV